MLKLFTNALKANNFAAGHSMQTFPGIPHTHTHRCMCVMSAYQLFIKNNKFFIFYYWRAFDIRLTLIKYKNHIYNYKCNTSHIKKIYLMACFYRYSQQICLFWLVLFIFLVPISENLFALVSLSLPLLNFRIFHCNFELCVIRHFLSSFYAFCSFGCLFQCQRLFGGGGKGGEVLQLFSWSWQLEPDAVIAANAVAAGHLLHATWTDS